MASVREVCERASLPARSPASFRAGPPGQGPRRPGPGSGSALPRWAWRGSVIYMTMLRYVSTGLPGN